MNEKKHEQTHDGPCCGVHVFVCVGEYHSPIWGRMIPGDRIATDCKTVIKKLIQNRKFREHREV